jgi:adenylosuccinate synthase
MPASLRILREVEPVYRTVKGWEESTSQARSLSELPPRARSYISFLEDLVGCSFQIVSTGANRKETIMVRDPFLK